MFTGFVNFKCFSGRDRLELLWLKVSPIRTVLKRGPLSLLATTPRTPPKPHWETGKGDDEKGCSQERANHEERCSEGRG